MSSSRERLLAVEIARFLRTIGDDDLALLTSGSGRIEVVLRPNTPKRSDVGKADLAGLASTLAEASDRAGAELILEDAALRRDQLQELARTLDIPSTNRDNVARLRDKIIEATVGYRLRSSAIRGREAAKDVPNDPRAEEAPTAS